MTEVNPVAVSWATYVFTSVTVAVAAPAHFSAGLPLAAQFGWAPSLQINGEPIGLDLSVHVLAVELSPQTGASPSGHNNTCLVDSTIVFEPSLTVLVFSPVASLTVSTITLATPEVPSLQSLGFPSEHFANEVSLQIGGVPSGTDLSSHNDSFFPSEHYG